MSDNRQHDDERLEGDPAPEVPASAEAELRQLRRRVSELELQLRRHQQAAAELETQLEQVKNTLSFRLGYLLIHGPKSWANLRRLPGELLALQREAKARRQSRSSRVAGLPASSERQWRLPEHFAEDVFHVFADRGLEAALEHLETQARDDKERAVSLTRLAKALRATDAPRAASLAQRAYELDPQPHRAKWLAFTRFKAGELTAPAALLASLPSTMVLSPAERARIAEVEGLARLRRHLPVVAARAPRAFLPEPHSCMYVTASALPFTVSGYTVRSHALIRAIEGAGSRVTAALRPGYPADRGIVVPGYAHEHDGVTYRHSASPSARSVSPEAYTASAAQALTELGQKTRPQVVHAASNHVNALPALLAARRLGVPFVYEVRGMWELTAATRQVDWEQSERFALERDLETLVAREADHVLTLTEGLAADLASRGVSRDRISIIPNSVDPERFPPRVKDSELIQRIGLRQHTFTLVYAGSLLHYEGLDDVLRALGQLVESGVDAAFLLAGDGEAREPLRQLTSELGLDGRVHFLGRLDPADIPRLWSLADVAAFARKPFRVCQLVSPLKPLEPMTMGIPVVVSDVAALREMVKDGETGLVHRSNDASDLAEKLGRLARDPSLRRALGAAARQQVLRDRTWQVAGARVVQIYRNLTLPAASPRAAFSAENRAP